MTLNSTTRRWSGLALKSAGVCAAAAGVLVALASPASAHTPKINADCVDGVTTLTVELADYNDQKENAVVVTDGDEVLDDAAFGRSYSEAWEVAGDVDHEFTVDVTAWDDPEGKEGWSFTETLKVAACVEPPTSTEPPTSSEPPPSSTEPPASTTVPTTPAPQGSDAPDELADTGASIAIPLAIGALLVLGGGGLLLVYRRRSKA